MENNATNMNNHTSLRNQCDVCIVGAGVSGLYAAYSLLERSKLKGQSTPPNIVIIEKLSRPGGRIMTSKYGEHVLEYGAMRFEPELQPCFAYLLKQLSIETKEFPPYTCPSAIPDMNSLTYEEITAIHRYNNVSPAFALLKHGLKCILGNQWDVENDCIHDITRDHRKAWLKKEGMFQGRYLHNHGLWDTMAHALSKNALDYLLHKGTFYHMLHLNPNAADLICFMLDILATATDNLITIEGGTYRLIDALQDAVASVRIVYDTKVLAFSEQKNGLIRLDIEEGGTETTEKTLTCKHVIFTCQKKAYDHIHGFSPEIRSALNSVLVVKLFKVFIIFTNPPFDEHTIPIPNTHADKVPCREIHYGYDAVNKTGMIMLYGDCPHINYWRSFQHEGSDEPHVNHNTHLKNHLAHYLRELFPKHSLPCTIVHYSIMDWSHDPYKCGVHLWKPGVRSDEVMKTLACFGTHKNVHVCGETYSNFQGFIEGSIRSVNGVINTIPPLT